MTGNLVQGEPIVQLNSFPERSNASHVSQASSVLSLILRQPPGNVMLGFSVTMVLINNNRLAGIGVMQVFVRVDGIVQRVIL